MTLIDLLYAIAIIVLAAIIIAAFIIIAICLTLPNPTKEELEEYDTTHYNEEDYRL